MRKEKIVTIKKDGCVKCNYCVKSCYVGAIKLVEDGAELISENCVWCGNCETVCPKDLISLDYVKSADEGENQGFEGINIDPNDIVEQIKEINRVRKFSTQAVSREDIETIVNSGKKANAKQGVSCVVLQKNIPVYEKIALSGILNLKNIVGKFNSSVDSIELDKSYLFKKANVVIIVKSSNKDNGMAVANNMGKTAQDLGLIVFNGNLFTLIANTLPKLKKMLKLKDKEKVVTTLVMGYPKTK